MNNEHFNWTVSDIIRAVNGQHLFGEVSHSFVNISTDSRTVDSDSLFIAIIGDNFDSHTFIPDVIQKNVRGIIIQKDKISQQQLSSWKKPDLFCAAVPDTTQALGDLAHYQRMKWPGSVIGITGTNGKTSVKEMTAAVLSTTFNTIKTQGNFNNHIGVPKTLFQIQQKHEWAIVEMGMNHPGEIAYLAKISNPTIGIITNIGPGHLEGVQSIEGVKNAKSELFQYLPKNGVAILNADDPLVISLCDRLPCPMISYGMNARADVYATKITENIDGCRFTLKAYDCSIDIVLPAHGRFMILNALAAAATGFYLNIPIESIKAGLESFSPIHGRLTIHHSTNGFHIIDDTYNANPSSMKAALDTLKELSQSNHCYLVCGDMYELGKNSKQYHKEIGEYASNSGITGLFATGMYSSDVINGAYQSGLKSNALHQGTIENLAKTLLKQLEPGDWILVKGSRAMKMERFVNQLL